MAENSPLVGSRQGADYLRTASAADGDASDLKNAAGERNLGLTDASNWRMSANMSSESDDYLREDARRCLDFFRAKLGGATTIYALPNGSFRAGQDQILRAAGFNMCFVLARPIRIAANGAIRVLRCTRPRAPRRDFVRWAGLICRGR